MSKKVRILIFGTLFLSAFFLANSLSSPASAASAQGGVSLRSQPSPNVENYNRGYRSGFRDGYQEGFKACAAHHYENRSWHGSLRPNAFNRGYADGYTQGYNRGTHSCSSYHYDQHNDHNDNRGEHSDGHQH